MEGRVKSKKKMIFFIRRSKFFVGKKKGKICIYIVGVGVFW